MTAVREERRLVTCMFVDVVGSTELVTQMGAERLKRELGNAFAEISGIIVAHGGTVEKYVGDAIYALFGAPVAHEDDPLRALRAAIALRDWCAAGGAHGHPFTIRVGIETGEAVVDLEAAASTHQQMSVGAVVNIAARLQQRADPGEILIGPTVREAAGAVAELEALGAVDLKGIGPLAAWRLRAVGLTQPSALPFVGRAAELGLLGHAYERAHKGRSVLAVVSGPPGQGKTRLVQEFLRERAAAARLITTRCRPADEVGVFAPVRDILGVTTLDALAEHVGRLCADDVECERVVAGLAESAGISTSRSLSSLPAGEREDEIVQAWRRYLAILGTDQLVVLAIDDIHWADPSLVRLVDRLTFGGPRLLVVATARPEFAEAAGVRPSGDRFFIELEGLEPDEARTLAAFAGRADARVVDRAEGNPLFLTELARSGDRPDLPLTLQGALGARLDQVSADDRILLSLTAVAGERFTAEDAAFLAQRPLVEVGRALARLTDLHFLDQSDAGFRFHHGLVREVAYGRLLTAERRHAHARFAEERAHPEDAESLAYHWWEALGGADAEWVWEGDARLGLMRRDAFRTHLAAGKLNGEHFALDRATTLLERAVAFGGDDTERALAEWALGAAYHQVLRMDEAWEHLLRAIELYDRTGGPPAELYAEIGRATQWVGAFRRLPTMEEVTRIADRGATIARDKGDLASLFWILRSQSAFLVNLRENEGRPEVGVPFIDEALEVARASGNVRTIRTGLLTKAGQLRRAGRYEEAAPLVDEAGTLMEGADTLERLNFLYVRAIEKWVGGDLSSVQQLAREIVALAEPMGPHHRTHAWSHQAEALFVAGDWDGLIELGRRTARLMDDNKATTFCRMAGDIARKGAIAHAMRGQREEALGLLRYVPASDVDVDIYTATARALLGLQSPEADRKMAEGTHDRWTWADAAVRVVVLGRPDDAERALDRMGSITRTRFGRALADGVREAVAELRGGPPATYDALRKIGYLGWIEILERRVDAEY